MTRKIKDNPYSISYNEEKHCYMVEFKDYKCTVHKIEVAESVYKAFDSFELEDISQIHKYRRHIEHLELTDELLSKRLFEKSVTIEEKVEKQIMYEELKKAIDQLSDIQKQRIKMYYFENLSLDEIAKKEGTTHQAISKSIHRGLEELKKNLKFFKF